MEMDSRYVTLAIAMTDMVVYKKEKVASLALAGTSQFGSLLLETRPDKPGV
jgi:hypothetical protein